MDVGSDGKPVIALAMGDPAGISPELTAKVVALDEERELLGSKPISKRSYRIELSQRTIKNTSSSISVTWTPPGSAEALRPGEAANSHSRITAMPLVWR